jgi:hypothetical protein
MDDETLYRMMKSLPDFDSYPIPFAWYEKFGIPLPETIGPKEYIESNYAMRMATAPKDLPPILFDTPQQNGRQIELVKVEEVKTETIQRPFVMPESNVFPAVIGTHIGSSSEEE